MDQVERAEAGVNTAPRTNVPIIRDAPASVPIPCHSIRLGDFLLLQGRPCQVIRISTSSATGQYRYLGVDLFTKQLCEESSSIWNPAPSVVVQTMSGPIFKQYRVLDIQEGQVVAMTETGDIKESLPVIDQSNLYSRIEQAFDSGRGSVRLLVLNDGHRELAVDMKVIHGSRPDSGEPDKKFREAVRENDQANVERSLNMGADIDVLNDQGWTALFTALENYNTKLI
jgi:hypothetical protein